jgi:hypothetical protein
MNFEIYNFKANVYIVVEYMKDQQIVSNFTFFCRVRKPTLTYKQQIEVENFDSQISHFKFTHARTLDYTFVRIINILIKNFENIWVSFNSEWNW